MALSSLARKPAILMTTEYMPSSFELLKKHFEIDVWDTPKYGNITKKDLVKLVKGKFGIYCNSHDTIDEDIIKAGAPTLKVVSTLSIGVNHVNLKALKENNVRLGYCPDVVTESTAELTVALLLATSRRIIEAAQTVKSGGWKTWSPLWLCGQGLQGSTVGIIGYGRIGHSVAKKLKAFAVKEIIYTSRTEKETATEIGAKRTDLDSLLRTSDFVIVTIALTPETKGIVSRSKIALLKKNAIFVNTGRGGLVDQDALVEALEQKKILAAGLDVMTPEPLPVDHPLNKLDNCVLLPHIGTQQFRAAEEMSARSSENIIAALKGTSMPAEYPL